MPPQDVQRGYEPTDEQAFGPDAVKLLQSVQKDVVYLLDRGYDLENSVTFVGNRYQLTARQRTALTRATAGTATVWGRLERQVSGAVPGGTLLIDGFNLIITLEAALSEKTVLLRCMDGTMRDLCGLRGTYRLLESTGQALEWIARAIRRMQAGHAVFFLDSPVSNSGRLRNAILTVMAEAGVSAEANLVDNADSFLWGKAYTVTSDAFILNRCVSWVNLAAQILEAELPRRRVVPLLGRTEVLYSC